MDRERERLAAGFDSGRAVSRRRSEVGNQRSEVRGQKGGGRSQNSEVSTQPSAITHQRSGVSGQNAFSSLVHLGKLASTATHVSILINRVTRTEFVLPFARVAACRDQLQIVYDLSQGESLRNHNDPRHPQAGANPVAGVIRHRSPIVRQDNSSLTRRPFEQSRVRRFAQACFVSSHDVEVLESAQQSAHDVLIEVLISKEPHRPL